MFTGLVECLAEVAAVIPEPPGVRFVIREPQIAAASAIGASIALNGCCLTVVAIEGDCLSFQAGEETLSRTNLGELVAGSRVNLERSLRMGDEIGGHLVTGHIDGVGTVDRRSTMPIGARCGSVFAAVTRRADGEQGIDRGRWSEPDAGGRGGRAIQRGVNSSYTHRDDAGLPWHRRPGEFGDRCAGEVCRAAVVRRTRDLNIDR